MDPKNLIRAFRLALSEATHQQSGRPIDELHVREIAGAKLMLSSVRGSDLIPVLANIMRSGVSVELDLTPKVRIVGEQSPGRGAER